MDLKLYNTLSREKEIFKPLKPGDVGMYNCGPTVYYFAHLGNLRAYIFADILRRVLVYNKYSVKQVINITDLGHLSSDEDEGEDKMTKGLRREGKPITMEAMKELAQFYTARFLEDLDSLNIKHPDVLPKASEHIREQIELIKELEKKGFTYKTSDGVYFDTAKKEDYGELSGIDIESLKEESRIKKNPEKKSPADFALWKFNDDLGFDTPWGKGFPGWHIECSAMAMKYLGKHFDIHTGGIDHIPVHHTNEIAQSEAATGERFVNYWLHSGFLNTEGAKMAKSEGNFITLKTLVEKGLSPLSYRYLVLSAHYRSPLTFSWESLEGAQTALNKIYKHFLQLVEIKPQQVGEVDEKYREKFLAYTNDDLDTPKALALLWELVKDDSVSPSNKKATLLDFDKVLGLGFAEQKLEEIPEEILRLVEEREEARKQEDWQKSDEIRTKITSLGYEIKDTDEGANITKI